jgi:hypothetical protein
MAARAGFTSPNVKQARSQSCGCAPIVCFQYVCFVTTVHSCNNFLRGPPEFSVRRRKPGFQPNANQANTPHVLHAQLCRYARTSEISKSGSHLALARVAQNLRFRNSVSSPMQSGQFLFLLIHVSDDTVSNNNNSMCTQSKQNKKGQKKQESQNPSPTPVS